MTDSNNLDKGRDQDPITENARDEAIIIGDQDQTVSDDANLNNASMGQAYRIAKSLEEEPADFVRGEVDVKEQMDRTARAMNRVFRGGAPDEVFDPSEAEEPKLKFEL